MILLDTNVISEMMRPIPAVQVADWYAKVDGNDLYTSTVSEAEIRSGLLAMPAGRKRDDLLNQADRMFETVFRDQIISFDRSAAYEYAIVMATRRAVGRPISLPDAMIAAIALARGFAVATRNVRDFEHTGASIINPFDAS